jgi:hypothetical protein
VIDCIRSLVFAPNCGAVASRGRNEIAIFDDPEKLTKWVGRRVTITGALGRFGSALVYPSIYIEISSMRRFGAHNTVYEGRKGVKP